MRNLTTCGVFVSLLLACVGLTQAQTVQGVVTGTVTDPTGAAVPGADVKLTNEGTNISQSAKSGNDGVYRFSLVPPGTYTLDVKAGGFTERQINRVVVNASQTVPLDVTLSVATATTTVEVTTQAPLVQTATSDLAVTVNTYAIAETALLTRNVFDLAFLAPTVTEGINGGPASGGARESGTGYLLNGADNNDNFSEGAINVVPPLESVAEFTILTNSMSAQYGRAGGAVVSAVQKSGSNEFHGVLYEFNRNRSFNASDFFQNRQGSPKPKYIRNQFGGQIAGPIRKDKTFFSFAYDQVTLHTGSELDAQVPTPTEYANMKAKAGPVGQKILAAYPLRTSTSLCPDEAQSAPDAIGHIGCIHVFDPISRPQHNYFGKIDQNFSSSDRLSFTGNFTWVDFNELYGGGSAANATPFPGQEPQHNWNMSLVETHVFNPRVINEFTVAHNRHYDNFFEGSALFPGPEVTIDGADYGLGLDFGPFSESTIEAFTQDRWQVTDNLSWTKGKHNFKFGGGWQYGIVYRNWDLGGPGFYEFGNVFGSSPKSLGVLNPDGTISGINDFSDSNFQNDFPYFEETAIDPHTGLHANAYRHYAMKDGYLFVNDDFKMSRRLTLNLGLRWERFGAPYEVTGKLAQFTNLTCLDPTCIKNARVNPVGSMWNTRNTDFAPRVGFAWDVFGNGKMALRGGYGIYYDRIFDNVWSNGAWNPPFYALVDFDASGSDTIFYSVPTTVGPAYKPDTLPGPAGRVSVRTMDVHMKDSSVQNFFFSVEHQLFSNMLLRVGYQGSLGRHLPVLMNLNRYDGLRYNSTLSLVQPNSLYTGFNYRANNVNSGYNSMLVEVQKRFSHGLQFQFSYTWSKLIDYGSDLFSGESRQGGSQPYYFVSNAHVNFEKGPGAFDHTHNWKANFIYELPFMRSQQGFLGHVLGGWQLSAFYQGYSGHPLEIYSNRSRFRGNVLDPNGFPENIGGDYNLDGTNNDHPVFVGSSIAAAYSNRNPADGIFTDIHKIGCGFPGAKSTNISSCNASNGVGSSPNTLFVSPGGFGVRFGSLGRNVFRGPWFNSMDAALAKNFKLTEKAKLQFRFEALNSINHPNFDGIVGNLNSSSFGRATTLVGSAPARRLQLGARLTF